MPVPVPASAISGGGSGSGSGAPSGVPKLVPGKLTGKKRGDALDFDPFEASLTVEELFGSLDGGPLVDAVIDFYQDSEINVPWFFQDVTSGEEQPSVVRSPFSRELQEDTVTAYKCRIRHEGLSQRVAGPVSAWSFRFGLGWGWGIYIEIIDGFTSCLMLILAYCSRFSTDMRTDMTGMSHGSHDDLL